MVFFNVVRFGGTVTRPPIHCAGEALPDRTDLLLDRRCDHHCNQTRERQPYRDTKHHHIPHDSEAWQRPPVEGCRGGPSAGNNALGTRLAASGALPVWVKTVASLVAIAVTTRMIAAGISRTIRPHLIAVAPEIIFSNTGKGCSH